MGFNSSFADRGKGRRFAGSTTSDGCGLIIADYFACQHTDTCSCIWMVVLDGDAHISPILPHLIQHFVARVVEVPPDMPPGLVGDYLFEIRLAYLYCFSKDWDLKIVRQYSELEALSVLWLQAAECFHW